MIELKATDIDPEMNDLSLGKPGHDQSFAVLASLPPIPVKLIPGALLQRDDAERSLLSPLSDTIKKMPKSGTFGSIIRRGRTLDWGVFKQGFIIYFVQGYLSTGF